MTIQITAREFRTFEQAEDYITPLGGAAMTLPGGRYLAIAANDCDRIEAAGGPAKARIIDRDPAGYVTLEVGQ